MMWKVFVILFYFYESILTATISQNVSSTIGNETLDLTAEFRLALDEYETFPNSSNAKFYDTNSTIEMLNAPLDNRSRMGYARDSREWINCPTCGLVHRTRIVGGRAASIREFPWMVSIHKNGAQHCGGAILDRIHVITAAHCLQGVKLNQLVIIASATNVYDRNAFRTRPLSAILNSRFEPETYDYDIAIITVVDPIPLYLGYIRPVCLPSPMHDPTGGIGIVSGWGALAETSNVAPEMLQKVELPIISNGECKRAPGLKGQVLTDRMMCAGYIKGRRDACAGDSGGPLVWENNGRLIQVGVVSWGIGCARANYYGVFTRITAMLPWIHNHVQNAGCK